MTQEEFFEEENARHIESHQAYLKSLDTNAKLVERQVIAQEKTARNLEAMVKAQIKMIKESKHED